MNPGEYRYTLNRSPGSCPDHPHCPVLRCALAMPSHLPPAAAPARSTPPVLQPGLPRRRTPTTQRVKRSSQQANTNPALAHSATTQPEGGDSAAKPSLTLRPHTPVPHQYHRNRCSKTSGLSAPLRRNPQQSTWKKSQVNIVDACARRNCRQVVSVLWTGAGDIRNRRSMRRIVDAPTWCLSLRNSPWILLYLQRGLSRTMRAISTATASSTGGRPTRWK